MESISSTYISNSLPSFGFLRWLGRQTRDNLLGFLTPPEESFDYGNNAPTYLLIPGLGCNNGAMQNLWDELKKQANVSYTPSLWGWFGSMDWAAKIVEQKVWELLKMHEFNGDLHLLGHSQGGLIAFKSLSPSINTKGFKIHSLTAAATPFLGAPVAKLISPFSSGATQINSLGWFLTEGIDPYSDHVTNIITQDDTIVPQKYQQIPGYISQKVQTVLFSGDHTDVINGEKVQEVVQILRSK